MSASTENTRVVVYIHPALRRRSSLFLCAVTVLLLAWPGWWGVQRVMWLTPDGQDMARVVRGAVAANQTLLTPPQAYSNVPITAVEMVRLEQRAHRGLAEYYVGSRLQFWRDTADQVLNPGVLHWGKNSAWMSWARVDWIRLGELSFLPGSSTATASASAEFRSNGGVINRGDYTYHLVHTAAGWRIDRDSFDYEPGYGP